MLGSLPEVGPDVTHMRVQALAEHAERADALQPAQPNHKFLTTETPQLVTGAWSPALGSHARLMPNLTSPSTSNHQIGGPPALGCSPAAGCRSAVVHHAETSKAAAADPGASPMQAADPGPSAAQGAGPGASSASVVNRGASAASVVNPGASAATPHATAEGSSAALALAPGLDADSALNRGEKAAAPPTQAQGYKAGQLVEVQHGRLWWPAKVTGLPG